MKDKKVTLKQYGIDVIKHGYVKDETYGHGYNFFMGAVYWHADPLSSILENIANGIKGRVTNAQCETGIVYFNKTIEDPKIISKAFKPIWKD